MDSEDLIQCPYDKNHQIRPSRFPYHLVKCRENNMKAAKDVATCPYNARHRVPKQELQLHISTCSDKCLSENFRAITFSPNPRPPVSKSMWQNPPCQEDWEDDENCALDSCPFVLDQSAATFLEEPRRDHQGQDKIRNFQSQQASAGWVSEPNPWNGGNGMGRGRRPENNFNSKPDHKDETFTTNPQYVQGTSTNTSLQYGKRDPRDQDQRRDFQSPQKFAGCVPDPRPWKEGNGIGRGRRVEENIRHSKHAQEDEVSPAPPQFAPGTSANTHLQNGQRTTRMEQKPHGLTGRTSPTWGPKPNPWKSEPVSSPIDQFSHNPNAPVHNGQRATRMEQNPNGMIGQTSPAWGAKPNAWKTAVSPPPQFVTRANSPLQNGQRSTRVEQKEHGLAGRTSGAWGSKANPWRTGSFQ